MKLKIYLTAFTLFATSVSFAESSLVKIACLKGAIPSGIMKDLDCVSDYDVVTKDGMCFLKFEFGKSIKKEAAKNVPEEWYESKALATYTKKANPVNIPQTIVFDDSVIAGAKSLTTKQAQKESFWSKFAFWRSAPDTSETKIDVQALAQAKYKTIKQVGQAVGNSSPVVFPSTLQGLNDLKRYLAPSPTDCAIPTRE
jgi:hypothetical protein